MDYSQSLEKINSLLRFGMRPGLKRIKELLTRLDNPQDKLKFVHVAGTNGKGTVCTLIANTLTAAGYKTGLYTSPYIMEFRERFRIDGKMITETELCRLTERVAEKSDEMEKQGLVITEFEFITALAFLWFLESGCDVVVLEVGLGGRFDATNVIGTPLVSVIMSISLDHTAVLGDTVEQIAFEKCGIIKDGGRTVVYADQPDGVLEVVRKSVDERSNTLTVADDSAITPVSSDIHGSEFFFRADGTFGVDGNIRLVIPFIGEHQYKNASAALTALRVLEGEGYNITSDALKKGFSTAKFPARLELMQENPIVLLDGAHNPGGAKALSDAIEKYLGDKHKVLIIGMLADKDVETAVSYIAPHFDKAYTLPPDSPRALSADKLADIVGKYCKDTIALGDYGEAYRRSLKDAGAYGAIVICGSLFLAGKMRGTIIYN